MAVREAERAAVEALAGFAAGLGRDAIPAPIRHDGKRALVNILATALAGCREPAVGIAHRVMAPLSGPPTSTLIGRGAQADAALAACLNAMAANIHDFDDTHPETILHPTAPVAPPLLALAESRKASGAELLRAFLIGAEVACRIACAVSPGHYARGWHITATCGVFGAAAGTAALLGLDRRRTGWALANAAVQAAGLVETLGTMSKSLGVGNAARGGMLAALLAEAGFSGPEGALGGERGWLRLACDAPDLARLTGGLGETWEFARNTYKPWPVGVVLNPVIEAAFQIAGYPGFEAGAATEVELIGHPLLRQRADRPDVTTGRESQVSAQHALAAVWSLGEAGLDAFTDAAVAATLAAGRPTVRFTDDPACGVASVRMRVHLADGTTLEETIAAARGSAVNPLSDADLEAKLAALAARNGFSVDPTALAAAIWELETVEDAGTVARLAAGQPAPL